ncbi:MAG: outer membrane beta-barrel protein [Bacteroidota bacterium]
MKKIFVSTLCIMLVTGSAFSQSKFRLGVTYNLSASTILSSDMSGMSGTMPDAQMKLGMKLNPGAALRAEYFFTEKYGLYLQTGYQQRGAIFKEFMDDYKPRYRLNYWDVNLGGQFKTKGLMKGHQFLVNLGITQHTLLSASRVYDTGSDNITEEFKMNNMGVFLGIGGNTPMFEKDIFQILLFGNYGISQLYSGNFEKNGMMGKNLLFGIQLSYLLGKPASKE